MPNTCAINGRQIEVNKRRPTDTVENAIERHLRAAADLMSGPRDGKDEVIARLDAILAKLSEPAQYPVTWVKLEKYVELTGDSMDSVQSRRRAGKWLDGVQCKIVGGRLWINLPAAQRWVEEWDARAPMRALLTSHRTASTPKK
jgi:hypothetical protein